MPALPKLPPDHVHAAIADDLRQLAAATDQILISADRTLTRFLLTELDQLRSALEARPASLETLPPELARDWMLPDGRARVQVVPNAEARNTKGLAKFVDEIIAVAPDAGGAAVTIEATSHTIVSSFRSAAIGALIAITLILFVA